MKRKQFEWPKLLHHNFVGIPMVCCDITMNCSGSPKLLKLNAWSTAIIIWYAKKYVRLLLGTNDKVIQMNYIPMKQKNYFYMA